jgi:hypothetical protein
MVAIVDEEVPTERLEAEVCTLAGQIAAATCRFVLVVAELDRRESWREWGCRSMSQWLSWKCALGIVAAREHVRVGRALEHLPRVTAAFAEGRLSYSKVRALTRMATPDNEQELLEFASVATASQLDRTVGAFIRTHPDREQEREQLDRRRLRLFRNADGTGVLDARLTREQTDLLRQALEKALGEVPRDDENASAEARHADALELIVRSFLAGRAERVPTEVVVHVDAGETKAEEMSPLVERLLCDTGVRLDVKNGDAHHVGRRTRTIPTALRRRLQHRDRDCCRFPGCTNTRFLHVHHLVHHAHGGPTNSENCVLLCSFHHRLVHEGGWAVWGSGDGVLVFTNRRGRQFTDLSAPLPARRLRPVATIHSDTIATALGEPLDLALTVELFHHRFNRRRN